METHIRQGKSTSWARKKEGNKKDKKDKKETNRNQTME
jgi:hypothetical protein